MKMTIAIIVVFVFGLLAGYSVCSHFEKIKQDNLLKIYSTQAYWASPPQSIELASRYSDWKKSLIKGDLGKVAYELDGAAMNNAQMASGLYENCPWLDGEMKWREKMNAIMIDRDMIDYSYKCKTDGILVK